MTNNVITVEYSDGVYELFQENDKDGIISINKDGKHYGIFCMSSIIEKIEDAKNFTDNLIDCDKHGKVTEDNKESWGF